MKIIKVKNKNKNKIFFVRHAETEANAGIGYDHPQHIKLTEKGHVDAKKLAKKIKSPSKIIVSKYFRTLQTAQPLMEKHVDVVVQVLPHIHEFTYLSPAKFIGENIDKKKFVREYWEKMNPYYKDGDIAESYANFAHRIHKSILQIKKLKGTGDVYIFTHGLFIKTFLLLNSEFPKLFKTEYKNKSEEKKAMLKFMHNFYTMQFKDKEKVKNCEIVDVTDIISKY